MAGEKDALPLEMQINLNENQAIGVFADFASVWHTPVSFVLDFVSVVQPATPVSENAGIPTKAVLPGTVCARVRIPPEQIFPLIEALQTQGNQWLQESGRSAPPQSWVPGSSQETKVNLQSKENDDDDN